MSSRSLVAIAVLGCLILVSILVALIILVTKSDTVYNVVCNSESNKEYLKMNPSTSPGTAGAHEVGTTVPSTAGGSTTARLLAPDCPLNPDSQNPDLDKAKCVLESYPLIDGHNDLAAVYRYFAKNQVNQADLRTETRKSWNRTYDQTDIPRLRKGKVGAQFWSCWVSCEGQYKDAVRMALDQLDVIKRFVAKYPDTFQFATSPQGILDAFSNGKIGSLIGVEGGHMIDSSLGNLRIFYELGVRYMTLTHYCSTPWADFSFVDDAEYNGTLLNGLTDFGQKVVLEMNRLGMMVDISHVSKKTMEDVLDVSKAPVIFSHSSAYHLCHHNRNVHDDVLRKVRRKGGIVMVNFYKYFIQCNHTEATISDVADHIDHIVEIAGNDHVGIGGDFSGIEAFTTGLEDVSKFPYLFSELVRRKWTDDNLRKLAGKNIIRVFKKVEKIRDDLSYKEPIEDLLPVSERVNSDCRTDF